MWGCQLYFAKVVLLTEKTFFSKETAAILVYKPNGHTKVKKTRIFLEIFSCMYVSYLLSKGHQFMSSIACNTKSLYPVIMHLVFIPCVPHSTKVEFVVEVVIYCVV